ncbi:hypothetical protein V8C86DRAFT_2482305 [Haematococcus lacustris]
MIVGASVSNYQLMPSADFTAALVTSEGHGRVDTTCTPLLPGQLPSCRIDARQCIFETLSSSRSQGEQSHEERMQQCSPPTSPNQTPAPTPRSSLPLIAPQTPDIFVRTVATESPSLPSTNALSAPCATFPCHRPVLPSLSPLPLYLASPPPSPSSADSACRTLPARSQPAYPLAPGPDSKTLSRACNSHSCAVPSPKTTHEQAHMPPSLQYSRSTYLLSSSPPLHGDLGCSRNAMAAAMKPLTRNASGGAEREWCRPAFQLAGAALQSALSLSQASSMRRGPAASAQFGSRRSGRQLTPVAAEEAVSGSGEEASGSSQSGLAPVLKAVRAALSCPAVARRRGVAYNAASPVALKPGASQLPVHLQGSRKAAPPPTAMWLEAQQAMATPTSPKPSPLVPLAMGGAGVAGAAVLASHAPLGSSGVTVRGLTQAADEVVLPDDPLFEPLEDPLFEPLDIPHLAQSQAPWLAHQTVRRHTEAGQAAAPRPQAACGSCHQATGLQGGPGMEPWPPSQPRHTGRPGRKQRLASWVDVPTCIHQQQGPLTLTHGQGVLVGRSAGL